MHQYIENADEKLLKVMLSVINAYYGHDLGYDFSENDIKKFDGLRAKRLNGETKMYSWEEAKSIITGRDDN